MLNTQLSCLQTQWGVRIIITESERMSVSLSVVLIFTVLPHTERELPLVGIQGP